ncbi:MAG: VOC family protein [Acidimicrobiia bacterium]|nr:VOC family protein [Actinomycetota bacterium]MBL6923899.1 VOC family protein [Acidimicrobiia bacterium]MBL6926390.1 VOC family protein [Acidimicrobiia bacterium]
MITRLNHAVLYVRDARVHQRFYEDVLGFSTVVAEPDGAYAFMRAAKSDNHHDIVFFTVGQSASDSDAGRGSVGLYHIGWEVATLAELKEMKGRLEACGALVGASDHGGNLSIYSRDPDGLEFEIMWLVPRSEWGEAETEALIRPLDLAASIERFGADRVGGG